MNDKYSIVKLNLDELSGICGGAERSYFEKNCEGSSYKETDVTDESGTCTYTETDQVVEKEP